jgi:hypothetical protein
MRRLYGRARKQTEMNNLARKNLQCGTLGAFLTFSFSLALSGQPVITQDKLNSRVGVLQGGAVFSPATAKPNATTGDFVADFSPAGGSIWVTNAAFLNTATVNDVLTFAFWLKRYDILDESSAFWADSAQRGFQAHVPWSDNTVYFDTGNGQRISAPINTFPDYSNFGNEGWWTNWHHFVFVHNTFGDKQIWIDGQQFLAGANTAPLATNLVDLWLGSIQGHSPMRGAMDDFAAYGIALSPADITNLFTGTAPDALGAGKTPLAYWNFNDAPVIGNPISSLIGFTIQANNVGGIVLDTNTIQLSLNSSPVSPTIVRREGSATYITYNLPSPPFNPGSTQLTSLTIRDTNNNTYTSTRSFVVPVFGVLNASVALPPSAIDKSNKGFKIRTYQVDAPTGNGVQLAENILAGDYGPNVADLTAAGGVDTNGYFTWPGVINLDLGTGANGHFNDPEYPASPFPGIPGAPATFNPTEHFAVELYTALEFTNAGLYTMVVNSDDDFATRSGTNPLDVFSAVALGAFDAPGGRGASDTAFQFYVQQPGVYGFRTVYEQGGAAANLEWFMINSDGTRVLINDITNAFTAYQWVPVITAAYVRDTTPDDHASAADPDVVQAVLVEVATSIATNTVSLRIDNVVVAARITKTNSAITVSYRPSPLFLPGSSHTAILSWTEGANQVSREWQFTIAPYTKDVANGYFGTLLGEAGFTRNGGGHAGTNGDYAIFFGALGGGAVLIPYAGDFINPAAANDELTVSLWQKKVDISDSAIMWAYSASGAGRPWGVHLPWGDNVVYFDTGTGQRLSRTITEFPGYTGNVGWWTNWHHFVFSKKANVKQIWIDGVLLVEGDTAGPLVTDFSYLYLGAIAPGNSHTHGWIDDFAIYATALGTNDIVALAGGAAPDSLPAGAQLLAYWNFNDAPALPGVPTISINRVGANVSITFTGTLQSSQAASGPYTNVANATSPYPVNTSQPGRMFFRSVQ